MEGEALEGAVRRMRGEGGTECRTCSKQKLIMGLATWLNNKSGEMKLCYSGVQELIKISVIKLS